MSDKLITLDNLSRFKENITNLINQSEAKEISIASITLTNSYPEDTSKIYCLNKDVTLKNIYKRSKLTYSTADWTKNEVSGRYVTHTTLPYTLGLNKNRFSKFTVSFETFLEESVKGTGTNKNKYYATFDFSKSPQDSMEVYIDTEANEIFLSRVTDSYPDELSVTITEYYEDINYHKDDLIVYNGTNWIRLNGADLYTNTITNINNQSMVETYNSNGKTLKNGRYEEINTDSGNYIHVDSPAGGYLEQSAQDTYQYTELYKDLENDASSFIGLSVDKEICEIDEANAIIGVSYNDSEFNGLEATVNGVNITGNFTVNDEDVRYRRIVGSNSGIIEANSSQIISIPVLVGMYEVEILTAIPDIFSYKMYLYGSGSIYVLPTVEKTDSTTDIPIEYNGRTSNEIKVKITNPYSNRPITSVRIYKI